MPPKKDGGKKPSAAKVVDDKTFGMKNKKGGAVKKQIAQLQSQAASSKTPDQKRKEAEKAAREAEKKAAEDAKKEAAELFKPVQVQKVPFGVDPKTILCQFFKAGNCEKGRKCKFSHDPAVERKTAKKDLYQDVREEDEKTKDTMDQWDEEKLRNVVMSKHGNPKTTTDKVCKYFIEAVENQKYGWFWTCPNGGNTCMYRHSLPPGFVLKTKEQRAAEKALMDKSPLMTLTLEDFIETERHKLVGITLTPVTLDSFTKWKKERLDKKAAEAELKKAKDASGRALFEKGGWQEDSEEESDAGDDIWDLNALREETEHLTDQKEQERIKELEGSV